MLAVGAPVLGLTLVLAWMILRGMPLALRALDAIGAAWIVTTLWMAIHKGNPTLGFLAIGLVVFVLSLRTWIRQEAGRSFFDPQLRWFQGLPRPIPGLSCRIKTSEGVLDCRVSRIDDEGVFIYREGAFGLMPLRRGMPVEMSFTFRDSKVATHASPIRLEERGLSAGLCFTSLAPDARKELGDFVEKLRGEGYV